MTHDQEVEIEAGLVELGLDASEISDVLDLIEEVLGDESE